MSMPPEAPVAGVRIQTYNGGLLSGRLIRRANTKRACAMSFRSHFRRSILTGLATLLPLALTIIVLVFCWRFVQDKVSRPINTSIKQSLLKQEGDTTVLSERGRRVLGGWFHWAEEELALKDKGTDTSLTNLLNRRFPNYLGLAVGILILVAFLYVLGWFMASVVGRKLYGRAEQAIARLPVVQKIYPTAKRVTTFLFGGPGANRKLNRVVAVEYPYRGVYAMGFVTGDGIDAISRHAGRDLITVFVPTSPVPATGFVLFVPADEVVPLPITVDESVAILTTLGVGVPAGKEGRQMEPEAEEAITKVNGTIAAAKNRSDNA